MRLYVGFLAPALLLLHRVPRRQLQALLLLRLHPLPVDRGGGSLCLGHQLLALSQGISTYKLHRGHRGINHPVKNLLSGKCEITSQNHGFTIRKEDVAKAKGVEITHVNLNDETLEGIRLTGKPVFSVQYHPEACPGPHDSRYLFDEFVENMRKVGVKKMEVA